MQLNDIEHWALFCEIRPLRCHVGNQLWLSNLSDEMKNTLQTLLLDCLGDSRQSKSGLDPNRYPCQVCVLIFTYFMIFSISQIYKNINVVSNII